MIVVAITPVWVFVALIETPGIKAWLGSWTVPPMAEFTCANAMVKRSREALLLR